jgi:hypothetical protein
MDSLKVRSLTNSGSAISRQGKQLGPIVSLTSGSAKPRLLDQVREAIRMRHLQPKDRGKLCSLD